MTEASGNFADVSGNGFTATPLAGLTYQNITLPNGNKLPLFNGAQAAEFWTSAFNSKFDPNHGSMIALAKVGTTEWTDGTFRLLAQVRGYGDSINIQKSPEYYAMTAFRTLDGDTDHQGYFNPCSPSNVGLYLVTWDTSVNRLRLYSDGLLSEPVTEHLTSGANWAAVPGDSYTHIGRGSGVSTDWWLGNMGYLGITDKVLSDAEANALFERLYPNTDNLLVIGDSKSIGRSGGWRGFVLQGIEASTGRRCRLNPSVFTQGGIHVYSDSGTANKDMSVLLDTYLADYSATPLKIIINLGANDAPWPSPQANFEANYIHIIDALRAKWPGVDIYLSKVWRQDYPENCALLNGYIDTVIAHYPSGVHLGPDETVWMEGGDDGATYSSDGIHYSGAAHPVVAALWLTAMGY